MFDFFIQNDSFFVKLRKRFFNFFDEINVLIKLIQGYSRSKIQNKIKISQIKIKWPLERLSASVGVNSKIKLFCCWAIFLKF